MLLSSCNPDRINSPPLYEEQTAIRRVNALVFSSLSTIGTKYTVTGYKLIISWIILYDSMVLKICFSCGPVIATSIYSGYFNQFDLVQAYKIGGVSNGHNLSEWFEGLMLPWIMGFSSSITNLLLNYYFNVENLHQNKSLEITHVIIFFVCP